MSQSRAAILAGFAAIAVVGGLVSLRVRRILLIGAVLSGVLLVFYSSTQGLTDALGVSSTAEVRFELWNRASYAIQDFSFTGIGAGMFKQVIPLLYPLFLLSPEATPFHSHNLYLQIAVDLGIPGLVGFMALVAFAFIKGVKAFRRGSFLALGFIGAMTAFLVNGFFDSPLWLNKPHPVPFFFMGMLIALGGAAKGAERKSLVWNSVMIFVLWTLASLVAISFVGDYFWLGFGLAIFGGLYIGWEASRILDTD